jgi:hypothetical protein
MVGENTQDGMIFRRAAFTVRFPVLGRGFGRSLVLTSMLWLRFVFLGQDSASCDQDNQKTDED